MVDAPRDALYGNDKIKVTHLYSPDGDRIFSIQEHELWLKDGEEWFRYLIPRDGLRELKNDFKKGVMSLIDKLNTFNKSITHRIYVAKIGIEDVGKAIECAYLNELDGPEDYLLMSNS